MRIGLYFCIVLFISISCRSGKLQKKGVDLGKEEVPVGMEDSGKKLEVDNLDFKQLKFKSDVDISSKSFNQGFPMTIQIEKDKVIWASVSIMVEVARAKVTPDSLQILDRFNRKYYTGTWQDLRDAFQFDLSFEMLQALIVGNLIFNELPGDKKNIGDQVSVLLQERGNLSFETKVDNAFRKIFEVKGNNPKTQSELVLSFKSFIEKDKGMLPSLIEMKLSGDKKLDLVIAHTKVDFYDEGLNFSFNVPAGYKKLSLTDF